MSLLSVKNLSASTEDKQILHGVNLEIKPGEIHVLMGPNGAGKSTLGNCLMGHPKYTINSGDIFYEGQNITEFTTDKRAKLGLFMSFQNPLEIPGLTLESFLRASLHSVTGKNVKFLEFKNKLRSFAKLLDMDKAHLNRDLNVGFSGGEKKKSEILQMLMLNPKLAILDETDSGLDVDAARTVSKGIEEFQKNQDGSLLIITHSTRILEALKVDYTHVLVNGNIVKTGDSSLIDEINNNGFNQFITTEA